MGNAPLLMAILMAAVVTSSVQAAEPSAPPANVGAALLRAAARPIGGTPDTLPPAVISSVPPDGAREVDAQALNRDGLVVWFSEPVDTSRMEVRLQTGSGSLLLWSVEARAETLRVLPEWQSAPGRMQIAPGTLYRLVLLGIRDWAGNPAGDLMIEFTTQGRG